MSWHWSRTFRSTRSYALCVAAIGCDRLRTAVFAETESLRSNCDIGMDVLAGLSLRRRSTICAFAFVSLKRERCV